MSGLPLWLILGIFIIGAHPHMVTYMEMLLSDPLEAVHRVEQDSSPGIQKIKIMVDSDRLIAASNRNSLAVPLSIESLSSQSHENAGPTGEGSRETLSKRQATGGQSTVKQPSKPPARTSEPAKKVNHAENKKPSPSPQASPARTDSKPPQKIEPHPKTETKPNVKVEPKTNQYGLGSTLVLTVKGTDSGEPSYVDQTQPHKLAKPLRFEPQVGPARVENNYQQRQSQYQEQTEKQQVRASVSETRAQPKEPERYLETYQPAKQIPQTYEPAPSRKEISPVYDEYYEQNREKAETKKTAERSEEYDRYEESRPTQVSKPIYRPQSYEEPYANSRDESRKRPEEYESKYVREVVNTPVRKPTYEDVYEPEKVEASRQVYRPEPVEDSYVIKRPVQQPQRRPVYEEERDRVPASAARPTYEESRPSYVDLRPSYEKETIQQENRKPPSTQDGAEYSGFPESFQPNRNPALSRPLQYDPPRVFPPSPCHSVFKYEGREPSDDSWIGDIYVSTDEVLVGMRLDITLDRPARLLSNWIADVKTKDNVHFTILSLRKRLVPGPAETVRIVVRFHPDGPVPFLQSINLNGRRICPQKSAGSTYVKPEPTRRPVFENPGDFQAQTKPTTVFYKEPTQRPPPVLYEERPRTTTQSTTRQTERRTTTEAYRPPRRTTQAVNPPVRPDPNPNYYEETPQGNRVPTSRPTSKPAQAELSTNDGITCGKPAVQPRPLVTHGQMTARGQWPWHAAIYKNVGIDLSYICGGSLISSQHVVTAAHCVTQTYDVKPLDPSVLVVYLGKYHLKLWSEGGVQNKQVSAVKVHDDYNNTDFRADLAVLVLSSPVEFTEFIRPVCLWDKRRTDISELENMEGTVIGWGFDEAKRLTEELMQAKMPVIKHDVCLWSYPEFFPQFTSNLTYCAGFRNGTSVCNGDSGGGMVFPLRSDGEERWFLRGLVSISVSEKENRVCDTKHYVVFTDLAKFLDWLNKFV